MAYGKALRLTGLVRQWKLLLALDACRGGMTFDQLRMVDGAVQVSERTIRRDVDTLILAGFPVRVCSNGGARIYLDRTPPRAGEDAIFRQKAS